MAERKPVLKLQPKLEGYLIQQFGEFSKLPDLKRQSLLVKG